MNSITSPAESDANSAVPASPNWPQTKLRFAVGWPNHEGPEHPHHCAAVQGWFSFGARGLWDSHAIARDFHDHLRFSECRGTEEEGEPLKGWWKSLTFAPAEGVVVVLRDPMAGTYMLVVWATSHDAAKKHFRALRDRYKRKLRRKRFVSNFTVLTIRCGGLMTRDITVRSALRNEDDLALNYGDDFSSWSTQFISQLKHRCCGVTILRGEPGTGKTTYLRYLTRRLRRTHRFYYLPLTVYSILSNPSAVDFWMHEEEMYPKLGKIVILEDAESLLMERASDNQANVSNLLNISDGFLGDVLKMHVICTINCPIERIDPALTRPGRLVAMREFTRLSPIDAAALATAKSLPLDRQHDYSLAELYNSGRASPEVVAIGFAGPNDRPND
jgi:hypothetical protein